jgi:hypothetical protein
VLLLPVFVDSPTNWLRACIPGRGSVLLFPTFAHRLFSYCCIVEEELNTMANATFGRGNASTIRRKSIAATIYIQLTGDQPGQSMLSWRTSEDGPFALPASNDPAARAAVVKKLIASLTRELQRIR